jgi:hypothetical protein
MNQKLSPEERFSRELRLRLKAKYGLAPTAAVLAREFNLRNEITEPITQESARRWLRGLCIPSPQRLVVLSEWLMLDHSKIWTSESNRSSNLDEQKVYERLASMRPLQREYLIKFLLSSNF